jgi:hypothetical protein
MGGMAIDDNMQVALRLAGRAHDVGRIAGRNLGARCWGGSAADDSAGETAGRPCPN